MARRAAIAILVLAALAARARPAAATKCAPRQVTYVARCVEGACDDGFIVKDEEAGRVCARISDASDGSSANTSSRSTLISGSTRPSASVKVAANRTRGRSGGMAPA